MNDDYVVHQTVHAQSCHAGNWRWQVPWTEGNMLQEEIAALQFEINFLQSIQCGLPNNISTPTGQMSAKQIPGGMCLEFQLNVQVVTTSAIAMPGALNEQSGRSLNNGQGITVPLVFRDDGTFEGYGSGSDAGTVRGAAPGETVSGQFGHTQSIAVSGTIQPGSCNTQPCQPDIMHLTLVGGPSQQITQAQARGVLNQNLQQATPTGAAQLQFDLPAYVGGSAQRTLLAAGIINSNLTVNLLQANNGTPAIAAGGSLLYELQKCRATGVQAGGGSAGVVIPGMENFGGPQDNGSSAATILVSETIHTVDVTTNQGPAVVTVNEAIHLVDAISSTTNTNIVVHEVVQVGDTASAAQPTAVQVKEGISLTDTISAH